jgi:hypothetical protein
MRYDREHENLVWWHTGESAFENNSATERERYLIWDRFIIPDWFPFQKLNN